MFKILLFWAISSFMCITNSYAQGKFEKESRIKKTQVPLKALLFLDSLYEGTKIKWYKEEALNHESIEAKFWLNESRYSIEFDTLGNIEDIEIEIKAQDIDVSVADIIIKQLQLDCSKFRIVKIQNQYTGSKYDLFTFLRKGKINNELIMKYEIVVRCNTSGEIDLVEYLFNVEGIVLAKNIIVFKNSSHLEY